MAMMSTARLIEKMKRLGTSIGSQTSDAPVSRTAHPPSRAATAATTTTVWRTLNAIASNMLLVINANLVFHGPLYVGPSRTTAFHRNRPECRTRTLQFEVHRPEQFRRRDRPSCIQSIDAQGL